MKKLSNLIEIKEDNLKENFNNNLNKEPFRQIVDKLKIDKSKLYKYNSSLVYMLLEDL